MAALRECGGAGREEMGRFDVHFPWLASGIGVFTDSLCHGQAWKCNRHLMLFPQGKLVIGHNMLLDVMHTIHQFYCPLPDVSNLFSVQMMK